ncbi:MAG TPA: FtsQ-type POTRA domain-containing protein, partial [Kofleriaceae bacterium]
ALGGGLWQGYRWLSHSPRFAITEIAIQGAHHVDADALRAALPIHLGDNAFVGLADIARAVRDEPWVAAVEVRRMLPHTIVIAIREHVAAAVAELGDFYLVDAAGRPFKRATLDLPPEARDAGEADGLPIITGLTRAAFTADPEATTASIADALAALDRWRAAARPEIGELHIDAHGALTLHTYDPAIAIQLGASGSAGDRIQAFDAAWAALSAAERARTRAIHLDARPDHVTVAFAKD